MSVRENKKNRIREAMETVLKAFENNPEKVALVVFKGSGKPSDRWSFFNRLIMLMNTEDARGFRQWKQVGRHVKKGAKAFYILAPVRNLKPDFRTISDFKNNPEVVSEVFRKVVEYAKELGMVKLGPQ